MAHATRAVFDTAELLEDILLQTGCPKTILCAQAVNMTFHNNINGSSKLKSNIWLAPTRQLFPTPPPSTTGTPTRQRIFNPLINTPKTLRRLGISSLLCRKDPDNGHLIITVVFRSLILLHALPPSDSWARMLLMQPPIHGTVITWRLVVMEQPARTHRRGNAAARMAVSSRGTAFRRRVERLCVREVAQRKAMPFTFPVGYLPTVGELREMVLRRFGGKKERFGC